MKCPQCDAEIGPDCAFCPKCGERLQGLGAESFAELRGAGGETGPVDTAAPQSEVASGVPGSGQPAKALEGAGSRQAEAVLGDTVTLWAGRYSWKGMIDRVVLSALVTVALITLASWWSFGRTGWLTVLTLVALLWLYQLGVYFSRRFTHRYRLTPQTFFHERGLLVKSTSPIEIIRIDDIAMKQTVLERLMGVGTIRILSNDATDPLLILKGIPDVRKTFEAIDQTRRAERRRRALRVNTV